MTGLQGALIGIGFGAAVFTIALGIGGGLAWWQERRRRPVATPAGVKASHQQSEVKK